MTQISQQGFPSITRRTNAPPVRQQGINTTVFTPAQTPVGFVPNRQALGTGSALITALSNAAVSAANISARQRADAKAKENLATASQRALGIRDGKLDFIKFKDQMIRGERIAQPDEDVDSYVGRTVQDGKSDVSGPAYEQGYDDALRVPLTAFTLQHERNLQDKQSTEVRALLATTLPSLETDEDVAAVLDEALDSRNFGQTDLEVFTEILLPHARKAARDGEIDDTNRMLKPIEDRLPNIAQGLKNQALGVHRKRNVKRVVAGIASGQVDTQTGMTALVSAQALFFQDPKHPNAIPPAMYNAAVGLAFKEGFKKTLVDMEREKLSDTQANNADPANVKRTFPNASDRAVLLEMEQAGIISAVTVGDSVTLTGVLSPERVGFYLGTTTTNAPEDIKKVIHAGFNNTDQGPQQEALRLVLALQGNNPAVAAQTIHGLGEDGKFRAYMSLDLAAKTVGPVMRDLEEGEDPEGLVDMGEGKVLRKGYLEEIAAVTQQVARVTKPDIDRQTLDIQIFGSSNPGDIDITVRGFLESGIPPEFSPGLGGWIQDYLFSKGWKDRPDIDFDTDDIGAEVVSAFTESYRTAQLRQIALGVSAKDAKPLAYEQALFDTLSTFTPVAWDGELVLTKGPPLIRNVEVEVRKILKNEQDKIDGVIDNSDSVDTIIRNFKLSYIPEEKAFSLVQKGNTAVRLPGFLIAMETLTDEAYFQTLRDSIAAGAADQGPFIRFVLLDSETRGLRDRDEVLDILQKRAEDRVRETRFKRANVTQFLQDEAQSRGAN